MSSPRPRVLILRSCRAPQFEAAVRASRERCRQAHIIALTHRGHREALLAAGVDEVIEIPGTRFAPWRMSPATLRRIRSLRLDEVVVPQMTEYANLYRNLHWLAFAVGAARVVIRPGEQPMRVFEAHAFLLELINDYTCRLSRSWDAAALLVLLVLAALTRRRPPRATSGRARVLHVIPSLGLGGAQRQLIELVHAMPAEHYDVDVLTFTDCQQEFLRSSLRTGVRVHMAARWPRMSLVALEILHHCRHHQYDLVHTWMSVGNAVGIAGARLAGAPRVVIGERNLSLWKRTWYREWWYRPCDMLAGRAADAITVNAAGMVPDHAAWAWLAASRIDVVRNGLQPADCPATDAVARGRLRTELGLPADAAIVGVAGRLAPEKDHATFLRALAEIRRVHPAVHGVLVGDGQLKDELRALATQLGVGHAVSFLGNRHDVRQLVAGFDVFLLPSIIEGSSNALIEAAFIGIPAVVSRVAGNVDVVEHPDFSFDIGDARAAASAVVALLNDASLAAQHANATRQRAVTHFTTDTMTATWLRLYRRLLLADLAAPVDLAA